MYMFQFHILSSLEFPLISLVLKPVEVLFKRYAFYKRQTILDAKDSVKVNHSSFIETVESHDMAYRRRLKECGAVRRKLLHPQGTALSTAQSAAMYLCK